ncbi:peptide synthetase [Microbacterium aurantiacum]|uniref:Peptide synthetase n=1 Tax=Microbacterium aurantiacum TaxID=162393 RepID=A0ABT8FUR1_9MICO|nr:peptide synthetase [Microbacterium aurantiacum]MDN4464940.1 peptide synthetase [Microbacterium aurantiacum]
MRLTNVTRVVLPRGRVGSYAVRIVPDETRPLPVSFDQGRHVGAGDRPGSWMSIALRLPDGTTRDAVARAWDDVVAAHGTLRTVFSRDAAGEIRLHEGAASAGEWSEHPLRRTDAGEVDGAVREMIRRVFDAECRPFATPSHRIVLIEPDTSTDTDTDTDTTTDARSAADPRPLAVIAADHAHVDMWSLLVLARDLLARLGGQPASVVAEREPFAAHTRALAERDPAPAEVHTAWREILDAEGGVMPRFPLPLGDVSSPRPEVVEVRDVLDAAELAAFTARAEAEGVRATALALSALARACDEVAGAPLRAVFPVHSRYEERWHDAVGWFITNSVIACADPDPRACAASLRLSLALGSHPLAPILAPWGGMPQAPGMFALSWLDVRRLPVRLARDTEAQWVSAAIETDGVMIWFVVGDDGLHLRCRYPDTPEALQNVGRWLDAVERAVRADAAGIAGESPAPGERVVARG